MSTVKLEVAPESLGVLLTVLTESLDDAWEDRDYLQTELTRVNNELLDMYAGDHAHRLDILQRHIDQIIGYTTGLDDPLRDELRVVLAESRRRPDDPN